MKNTTLIVTGGNINKQFLKIHLQNCNNIIAVDNGLKVLHELNILPNYIVGDFDTIDDKILKQYEQNKNVQICKFPPEKDYTDTDLALNLAIKLESDNVYIIGAIGTRIDHTLGNIHALYQTLEKNINVKILDENNEIYLINKTTKINKTEKKYISLIPLTSKVEGVTLKGFKYNVENEQLVVRKNNWNK